MPHAKNAKDHRIRSAWNVQKILKNLLIHKINQYLFLLVFKNALKINLEIKMTCNVILVIHLAELVKEQAIKTVWNVQKILKKK